jgi:hypothetical protein
MSHDARSEEPEGVGELPGVDCRHCQVFLPDFTCEQCGASYCPYCGAHRFDECEHLVMWHEEDHGTSFAGAEFEAPSLPEDVEDCPIPEDSELQLLFGEAYPLLRVYIDEYDLWSRYIESDFPEILQRIVSIPIRRVDWEGWWMAAGSGEHYFSPVPEQAKAEIRRLLGQLEVGFKALERLCRS